MSTLADLCLRLTAACVLGASAAALQAPEAGAETFAEARDRAVARLITDLEGLAAWSADSELYAERDRAWRAVLELDSEHAAARKALRFSKKNGLWVEPAAREVKNFNAKALLLLPEKRQAVAEPFRTTMLTALEKFDADEPTAALVYREILAADPDDAVVHAVLGEVKFEEAWVLHETVTAKARRGQMKELIASALADTGKLFVSEIRPFEAAMGVAFTHHYETKHVRVLGSGAKDEVEKTLRACEAAGDLVRFAFGLQTEHLPDYTVYLLANGGEKDAVLSGLPGIEPSFREFLKNVVGAKIPQQPYVVYWDRLAPKRIDGSVRQTLSDFFDRGLGLGMESGWAYEGLGLYLTRELVGTRLTWFIQPDGASKPDPLRSRLAKPDTNWINEAFVLLSSPNHQSFAATLERDVNGMNVTDVMYAYALAAYFIEGRPTEGAEILQRIGHGVGGTRQTTAEAVKAVLKLDLRALEKRLVRWLSERR
ncbi:MAG: hypothetical protein JNL28_14900 [Planctomycetes bacterium]|nr:hypothetical protein [Planctomycetota bacterium]